MKFCSHCGSNEVEQKVPAGDNRLRYCCIQCDAVFYENPKIVAGCIAQWQGLVLLCRRAIEPRKGFWTLPAGFMENHETIQEAAARETFEEATANISNMHLQSIYNLPHISQVYMMFRADVEDGIASPGLESQTTEFVAEKEIPWNDLAFPVIQESLELYFADRKRGTFELHTGEIRRQPDRSIQIIRYQIGVVPAGDRHLLSVIELGGYPDFRQLYQRFGYKVTIESSMRKALAVLKRQAVDVIVAEFNYQHTFRDRISSLESIIAVAQRNEDIRFIVLYEQEFENHLDTLRHQYQFSAAIPFPITEQKMTAVLQEISGRLV